MGFLTSSRSNAVVSLVSVLLISCAGERAPEGGPIDVEPPFVVSTVPPNYTTRFSGASIAIEFNKYVDQRSVEGAIFTSPSLGQLEFHWSGREVEIRFSEKLRRNTTYVVTIGTDVVDTHNKNRMTSAYTLAFTTGEDIDHGAIGGRVFPRRPTDPPTGVMIFAYNLNGLRPDTLDARTTRPDYVTQTGKNGDFLLQHLSFGPYRVYAVRDDYKNLLYDPEVDEFGVPSTDILLTPEDTLASGIWMRLEKEDTSAVRLLKVSATNQRHALLEFSSPIDTSILMAGWFRIADTLGRKRLKVLSICPVFPKLTSALVVTDSQDSNTVYRLEVDSIHGANGMGISASANQLIFSGAETRDTLGPRIASLSISDSAKEVDLHPRFLLQFSDAVRRDGAEKAVSLLDSTRAVIPLAMHWFSDAAVEIAPTGNLVSTAWFTLRVSMRNVADLFGIHGRDSIRVFRFQTLDEEIFSSIEGTVGDSNATDRKGEILLLARNVARKEPKEYTLQLEQSGAFTLHDIAEGKYILQVYRDRNGNRKYDTGHVFPYQPSERFTQYPDTLKLRARWPLEGVGVMFH